MAVANRNFFALLDDDEADDFTAAKYTTNPAATAQPVSSKAAPVKKQPAAVPSAASAKLPSKPLPPAEAVRAERDSGRGRGSGRRGGRGEYFGRGGGGGRDAGGGGRDAGGGEGEFHGRGYEGGGRGRGRRGGGFMRSSFDSDDKRKDDGVVPSEEEVKPNEAKEDEKPEAPEEKEMTLDEYEKIMQEKRKGLGQPKLEERKVEADNELKKMQVVDKKSGADVFIKLGSDKEKLKKKDSLEKEKKAININEFLRPAEGERFSPRAGRGRGRGFPGRFAAAAAAAAAAPADNNGAVPSPSSIDNPQEFPQLGKK